MCNAVFAMNSAALSSRGLRNRVIFCENCVSFWPLSVPTFKIKILISCQNQVELDVILQYQFVRGQKICMFDTPMQFSELHKTRHWPL